MSADRELRYELKMVCDGRLLAAARNWIRLHPEAFGTAYPARWVNNLYFDTPDLNSFNANLRGVSTRQKLRLRWYNDPTVISQPRLELKRKHNMLGDKKRQTLDCDLDWQRPYHQLLQTVRQTAAPEWLPWLNAATMPTLLNRYRREYFASPDRAMRATLDYDLSAYDQRLAAHPNRERPLPGTDNVIIEVKAAPHYAERLEEAMRHFPQLRSRHSKYVNGLLAAG